MEEVEREHQGADGEWGWEVIRLALGEDGWESDLIWGTEPIIELPSGKMVGRAISLVGINPLLQNTGLIKYPHCDACDNST